MKFALTTFLCIFFLNVNFAQSEVQTTRAERSQIGQMQQAKKSATKTFMVSLDRYREAVKILDEESQAEIKKDMVMRMTKIVSTNKVLLKEVARSEGNRTQIAETKDSVSKQSILLKQVQKATNTKEIEQIMLDFLETLKK